MNNYKKKVENIEEKYAMKFSYESSLNNFSAKIFMSNKPIN